MGKGLVIVGLGLNLAGAYLIGAILPRSGPVHYGSAVPHPITAVGRFAERWGWRLIGGGFALQLVGTVLWT